MSRNRLERGQKPKPRRGSGNKAKQEEAFNNALSSSMRDGMRDFMDSPGMQGPVERQREEQLREMFIKATKDEMGQTPTPTSKYMNNELERLRQMRRKK